MHENPYHSPGQLESEETNLAPTGECDNAARAIAMLAGFVAGMLVGFLNGMVLLLVVDNFRPSDDVGLIFLGELLLAFLWALLCGGIGTVVGWHTWRRHWVRISRT